MEECYFLRSYWLKTATLLKVTLLNGCFSRFLNCPNSAKLSKRIIHKGPTGKGMYIYDEYLQNFMVLFTYMQTLQ